MQSYYMETSPFLRFFENNYLALKVYKCFSSVVICRSFSKVSRTLYDHHPHLYGRDLSKLSCQVASKLGELNDGVNEG
jgi:hypothetical protein